MAAAGVLIAWIGWTDDGSIDELRIYDYALSDAQIRRRALQPAGEAVSPAGGHG